MKILFFTLVQTELSEQHNIYADLCRELMARGCTVKLVCPAGDKPAGYCPFDGESGLLRVATPQVEKVGRLQKGLATLMLGHRFLRQTRRAFSNESFDLILYSTPPITLYAAVRAFKRRCRAETVLLLKDIFPQNAVDLGMLSTTGWKKIIYCYFRRLEQKLYAVSDVIGCMSPANVDYLRARNPLPRDKKITVIPNAFSDKPVRFSAEQKAAVRNRYGLPREKCLFVYGGNIGAPQGIDFIEKCLAAVAENAQAHFVFCGGGTQFNRLKSYAEQSGQANLTVMPALPREEYEAFVGCCDVGLIFLDDRFTIPNFPSRLLSYLQKSLPVLAATDCATDLGTAITDGGYGLWCESRNPQDFAQAVKQMLAMDLEPLSGAAAAALTTYYGAADCAETILKAVE